MGRGVFEEVEGEGRGFVWILSGCKFHQVPGVSVQAVAPVASANNDLSLQGDDIMVRWELWPLLNEPTFSMFKRKGAVLSCDKVYIL